MIEVYGYSIATVPAVCAVVYGIIEFFKHFVFDGDEKFRKYIPEFAALLGAVITLIAFFASPELVPVGSWQSALLMGAASGLSAVGVNQIKKQAGSEDDKT